MQLDLFQNPQKDIVLLPESKKVHLNESEDISKVVGLEYVPEFISLEEHDELLSYIHSEKWLDDLKRRVQHYGFKYDYKTRN